jgi:hypothetical protein
MLGEFSVGTRVIIALGKQHREYKQ